MQILRERRWKEVTAIFNFPSTATNASFVLRKYYVSLLHHYEQIYYFKARVSMSSGLCIKQSALIWINIIGFSFIIQQPLADSLMSPSPTPVPAQRTEFLQPTSETQASVLKQQRIKTAELPRGLCLFFFSIPKILEEK